MDDAAAIDDAIGRVLAGEREAYRRIVQAYEGRLVSFFLARLGSADEAKDAAQETFVRAWSALGGFRRGESFSAWLFAIAANQARKRYRFRLFDSRKVEALAREQAAAAPADPAEAADGSARSAELRRAVAGLDDGLRAAVELFYFGGLSVAETATALGLGEEAVKSRLFRARGKLRDALERPQPKRRPGDIL